MGQPRGENWHVLDVQALCGPTDGCHVTFERYRCRLKWKLFARLYVPYVLTVLRTRRGGCCSGISGASRIPLCKVQ